MHNHSSDVCTGPLHSAEVFRAEHVPTRVHKFGLVHGIDNQDNLIRSDPGRSTAASIGTSVSILISEMLIV